MPSALRALLTVAVVGVILAGVYHVSRPGEHARLADSDVAAMDDVQIVETVSNYDEERMHRVAIKLETAQDMLDGRLTVAEAAARFLEVCSSDPESLENLRLAPAGSTDEEKAVCQVLTFARVQVTRQPQRYSAAFAQAEREAATLQGLRQTH